MGSHKRIIAAFLRHVQTSSQPPRALDKHNLACYAFQNVSVHLCLFRRGRLSDEDCSLCWRGQVYHHTESGDQASIPGQLSGNPLNPGGHYEETMSLSRYTAPLLTEAWAALCAEAPQVEVTL
jgi:hypothetical protein